MATTIDLSDPETTPTRADLRQKIAVMAGCRTNADTPLDKGTLNSVHAYLTGEFYYPPDAEHKRDDPRWVDRHSVLVEVVHRSEVGEPEDVWSGLEGEPPTELRRPELLTLAEQMDDKREWTP